MAFFPNNFYGSDASFTPLFRLLDDFDTYSRQSNGEGKGRGRSNITFQPKFDVREVNDAYELHGELPGLDKKDVSIEFSDPHTLLIRGRVERSYTAGTPPVGLLEDTQMSGAITEGDENSKTHQATVEDDAEDEQSTTGSPTPATSVARPVEQPKKQDSARYWVSERSIGEFSRTFSFPGQISPEAVTAGLKDGILTVRVPKAPKHEVRRINVD